MNAAAALALALLAAVSAGAMPSFLTLDEALRTARAGQPQLRQAAAATSAAEARSDEARAPLLPQVAGSASYQRTTANVVTRQGAAPASGSTENWTSYGFNNIGLSATQLVYDFGQAGKRWHAARANASAQRESEKTTMSQVVFAVRTAFFQARAAKGLVQVAQETSDDQLKHLDQVQGFVDVGTQPQIALAQAKTGVANARVSLIVAENGYRAAKAQLNQAMGVEGSLEYDVADDSLPAAEGETGPVEPLVDEAVRARPELSVLASQVVAEELTVRSLESAYAPTLGFNTGLTDAGQQLDGLTWNWSAALTLSVPVFLGGQTQAQIREAKANLASLHAQADLERQQVRLEVEQARLAVRAASESVGAAEEALVNSREQLRLAEGRYETGVGSIIELTDAQVAYTSAGQQKVQAEYGLAQARALFLKSLGRS